MSDIQQDMTQAGLETLREIGNIGAGHAATALAVLLNRKIDMNIPLVRIVPFTDIPNITGDPEGLFVASMVNLTGDLNGYILFTISINTARNMAAMLFGSTPSSADSTDISFTDLELSAFCEVTNIMVGSYINAISVMTNFEILPTVPSVCIDMIGAILSVIAVDFARISDSVIYMESKFISDNNEPEGNFFLIPDEASYEKLMKALGVMP